MKPAPPNVSNNGPRESRRPVFSPQFGNAYADIRPRPGDATDDDANTDQTLTLMIEMASIDSGNPLVIAKTAEVIGGARNDEDKARRIYAWIKSAITFQEDSVTAALAGLPDPNAAEILIRPADLIAMRQPAGDCDDFTMLSVAMLTAARVPARMVAIEQDRERPGFFSHVYAEVFLGDWQAFDASHGDRIGWSAAPTGKRRHWQMKGNAVMNRSRMGAIDWGSYIQQGIDITGKILVPRLGVPQIPGGMVRLPNGTIASNNPNAASVQFPGFNAQTTGEPISSGALLGIAGVVVAVIVFAKIAKS